MSSEKDRHVSRDFLDRVKSDLKLGEEVDILSVESTRRVTSSNQVTPTTISISSQSSHSEDELHLTLIERIALIISRFIIEDKDLTSPPGSPTDAAMYIVGGSATGDWSGQDNNITVYDGEAEEWLFIAAEEGFIVWAKDENKFYNYSGSAWVELSAAEIAAAISTHAASPTDVNHLTDAQVTALHAIYTLAADAGEINALAAITPLSADEILIEDASASYAKKSVTFGNFEAALSYPGGSLSDYYTWINLNTFMGNNALTVGALATLFTGITQLTFANAIDNQYYYCGGVIPIPSGYSAEITEFLAYANNGTTFYYDKVAVWVYYWDGSTRQNTNILTEKTNPFGTSAGLAEYHNQSMDASLVVESKDDVQGSETTMMNIAVRYQVNKGAGSGTIVIYGHAIRVRYQKL